MARSSAACTSGQTAYRDGYAPSYGYNGGYGYDGAYSGYDSYGSGYGRRGYGSSYYGRDAYRPSYGDSWAYGHRGERYRLAEGRGVDADGCTLAESPVYMPDGRTQTRFVRVCRDSSGRYAVVD